MLSWLKKGKKKKASREEEYRRLDARLKNERRDGTASAQQPIQGSVRQKPASEQGGGAAAEEPEDCHRTQLLFGTSREGVKPPSAAPLPQRVAHRVALTDIRNALQTVQCSIADRIVIGRNPEKSDLTLPDNAVSERHCEIVCRNGRFYLRDLGSSNGTYVDGESVRAETEIHTGMVLELGRKKYRLTLE